MKNIKLSTAIVMSLLSMLMLNSCSSSRGFEGYYPENRITGKGVGYGNIEKPNPVAETPPPVGAPSEEVDELIVNEEVVVENISQPEEVLPKKSTNPILINTEELTPREQKWVNKLGLQQLTDQQPKKMGFLDKVLMKMYTKMAQRQMNKYYGITDVQRMDIADIFAIVSIASGGMAFLTFYGVFLFGIAAIVFGALALRRGTSRRGMAIAGIVLGAVAIFFWIMLWGFVIGSPWFVR